MGQSAHKLLNGPKKTTERPKNLEGVMIDFMTASAKRYNKEPNVKHMDVVNETVLPNGDWFGPKKGTNLWENPWLKMGLDSNGFPNYIVKAFEIATEHAPNVKLVYNQNAWHARAYVGQSEGNNIFT